MKNLILLVLFTFAFSSLVSAQAVSFKSESNGTTIDTVTNATVKYQKIDVPGWANVVTIVATITKISGTVGGTITMQQSIDGVNWLTRDIGTVTATNVASQSFHIDIQPNMFAYYRLAYTGTGTMAAKISTKYLKRTP